MATPPAEPATRSRLVSAMTDALQRRGLHGIGLTELLHAARAPKGVLYHHFPGGKSELAVAAIDAAVAWLCTGLDQLLLQRGDPVAALRQWMAGAQKQLERSGFERGCPLAAVALESTPDDAALRAALATGFAALRERLAAVLVQAGVAAPRAAGLAVLTVAAYEGALIQARVAGSAQPMQDTADTLLALIAAEVQAARPAA
jgi:TetR/AcrR family transcriptional repressor of lmrAB and yxaGH operons